MPARKKYRTLYERIVANTRLDEETGCWVWTSSIRRHYPCMTIRVDGKLKTISPHRAILEEVHRVYFPLDEAGHLCANPLCVNPTHLEIQTKAHNLAERRGYLSPGTGASWIPVLFPFDDAIAASEAAADAFEPEDAELAEACPF